MLICRAARAGIVPAVAALWMGCTGAGLATAQGGATKDPCKLLTKQEIAKVFGGTVSDGKKGLTTAEKSQCEYSVGGAGERPEGNLIVVVVFVRAKAAYNDLKKFSRGSEPITEFPNAFYIQTPSTVQVLAGDVLLGVQGIFMPDVLVPSPAHLYEVRTELLQLAKLAVRRL